MKKRLIIIILMSFLLCSGCQQYSLELGAFSINQPVLLGKVQAIGSTTIATNKEHNSFDISNSKGRSGFGVIGSSGAMDFDTSSDNRISDELKAKIRTPDEVIKIKEIYIESACLIVPLTLLVVWDVRNSIGVEGGVYAKEKLKTNK
jgi:hypothetical protein